MQGGDEGRFGSGEDDLGAGEGREADFHKFRDAREEGRGNGNDFGGGRDHCDEQDVFLDGHDDGRGVEEGGGERNTDFAGFEGCRRDGFEVGEEDFGYLGRLLGEVGGRGEDGGRNVNGRRRGCGRRDGCLEGSGRRR